LLLNYDVHKEALMKVLEQDFVDHDVTVGQFGGIVGNIKGEKNTKRGGGGGGDWCFLFLRFLLLKSLIRSR